MADARSERVKDRLRSTMLGLLQDMPFCDLTVRRVVEGAGVSKAAFYNHYADLATLAQDCLLHERVNSGLFAGDERVEMTEKDLCLADLEWTAYLLAFLKRNPNLARAIFFEVGVSPYFSTCDKAERALIRASFGKPRGFKGLRFINYDQFETFLIAGVCGQIRRWVQDGMRTDIESVSKCIIFCSTHAAMGYFNKAVDADALAAIESWHWEG